MTNIETDAYLRATAAVEFLRGKTTLVPGIGIILGSGLGEFGAEVEQPVVIPYADIPYFPRSTVVGHSGQLVIGTVGGVPVAVMQGRVHAYEGYPLSDVTFPARVLGLLGCRTLIVTNAAGGIRETLKPGALVAISDHLNLTGTNAALGPNEPRFGMTAGSGERFFDMSTAYTPRLRRLAVDAADRQGFLLTEGIYLAVLGPSFETPAEIRAFRTLGADLVGMSTVHEVIVARHMGLEVLGLSLVTNMAAGVLDEAIDHAEVLEIGRRVAQQFTALLKAIIPQIADDGIAAKQGD
jgi:purine-nucleoside phosphorylase